MNHSQKEKCEFKKLLGRVCANSRTSDLRLPVEGPAIDSHDNPAPWEKLRVLFILLVNIPHGLVPSPLPPAQIAEEFSACVSKLTKIYCGIFTRRNSLSREPTRNALRQILVLCAWIPIHGQHCSESRFKLYLEC
jgi:hypothetical protein